MLGKYGGNLAAENSVAWMFDKKGYIVVEKAKAEEEALMAAAIDAGADDMRDDGEAWEIVSAPDAFQKVLEAVKALGIEPGAAEIAMLPQNYIKLEGKPAQQMVKLMEAARGPRRHQEGLVERRHRREGDRGLVGVRIFGIDPGSERTGYGCVESDGSRHRLVICGTLSGPPARPSPTSCAPSTPACARCSCEHRPDCVAVENIFYARNVRSALKLGHARGVALLAAVEAGLPIVGVHAG